MSNEEIVKEIDEATRLMAEARVNTNEALCRARNVVMNSKGNEEAYNKGLEDAWELAKKFYLNVKDGGLSYIDIGNIYGMPIYEILQHMTPQEALAKLEAYEKKQNEIKVGDVVTTINGECGYIVTNIQLPNTLHCINSRNGYALQMKISSVKKTGKHIDIKSVFEQIAE